ncbi:recombinase family protein [Clostridium sp. BJN0001]|uniref:recombinase family protein n=1 Tax=Clostridium sp. BJN0001 TaxID=2930219 RepID=UPI001FD0144E|nr:recombinase family protein [Clostridium sp. BJN0001]
MGKIYGYTNILNSSLREKEIFSLFNNGCEKVIEEKDQEKKERLYELLKDLNEEDVLIIARLNRVGKTIKEACDIFKILLDKGGKVKILNIGVIDTMDKLNLIQNAFTTFLDEHKDITNKVKAIKLFNKSGIKEKGIDRNTKSVNHRRNYTEDELDRALKLLCINGGNYSYTQVVKKTGISKSTLIRANKRKNLSHIHVVK